MTKKILVTGIGGFVGTYVADKLSGGGGDDVIGIVRSERNINCNYKLIVEDISKGFNYSEDVDVVVHIAAANTPPQGKYFTYKDYAQSNVTGTINVIRYAKKHSTLLIYLSSTATFGNVQNGYVSEKCRTINNPDFYALTKYAG